MTIQRTDGRSIAFSPLTLISGSQDAMAKLWNLEGGECTATWRAPRPCEGMNIDHVTGLTDTQKATLKILGPIEC